MKDRKYRDRIVAILEMVLLAGMVLLSFYLFFCSVSEGEQAVNGASAALVTGVSEKAVETEAVETEASGTKAAETSAIETEAAETNAIEAEAAETNAIETEVAETKAAETEAAETDEAEMEETEAEGEAAENGEAVRSDTELVYRLEEESTAIRVRILDSDYTDDCFEEIQITGSVGFTAERGTYGADYGFMSVSGQAAADFTAGEDCTIALGDLAVGEAVRLIPYEGGSLAVMNLERSYGTPEYTGILVVYRLADGLVLVNVLELEEYLYSVVPSEMPSYYPAEAQKAQAVCARTYAWLCVEKNEKENRIADLDDSVTFQVYNNRKSTDASREAVDATCGEVLAVDEALYYSTSCLSDGHGDLSSETDFRKFLDGMPEDGVEYGSAWLRWQVKIPTSQILQTLADEYAIRADALDAITVETRGENGQAVLLRIEAGGETLDVEGEYAIREFLAPLEADVVLMDGSTVSGMQMLPSAFFYLSYLEEETEQEKNPEAAAGILCICGGGYGHGNGMSQCGAAQMAADGASYLEILDYYFG